MKEYEALNLEAKTDLDAAKVLLEKGIYSRSIKHSQEAAEKIIKAVLSKMGHGTIITHYISEPLVNHILPNANKKWKEKLKNILDKLIWLEDKTGRLRYPRKIRGKVVTPSKSFKKEDAIEALKYAEEVIEDMSNFLENEV